MSTSFSKHRLIDAIEYNDIEEVVRLINDIDTFDAQDIAPLMLASKLGRTEIAAILISKGIPTSVKDDTGSTPFLAACFHGNVEVVRLLFDAGVDINERDKHGRTAILRASMNSYREVVEFLLANDADPNIAGNHGETPLMASCKRSNARIAKMLLDAGAQTGLKDENGESALMIAAKNGWSKLISRLTKYAEIELADHFGYTALHHAVAVSSAECVTALLKQGANIESIDDRGNRPLHLAVKNDTVTQLLLDAGANPNATNNAMGTPLMNAAYLGHHGPIPLLVKAGADINAQNSEENTALHLACYEGKTNAVQSLINLKADTNLINAFPESPLVVAYMCRYKVKPKKDEIIKLLISAGADINVKTEYGNTLLMDALRNEELTIASRLITSKSDLDSQNDKKATALHFAAEKNQMSQLKKILDRGANPNIQDIDGSTPLMCALSNYHNDAARMLIQYKAAVDIQDNNGNTPLMLAISKRSHLAKQICEMSTNISIKNKSGLSALDIANNMLNHELISMIESKVLNTSIAITSDIDHPMAF